MPVTSGLFALSLECLGNFDYGRRDKYFTFGEKKFLSRFRQSLAAGKRDPARREQTRRFEKFVIQDVELLHDLRNAFYGHSLMHLQKDRVKLAESLRRWYIREGFSSSFAQRSFPVARLENSLTSEFWPLYKIGLRTSRLFLGLAYRCTSMPFASHDFAILGDLPTTARTSTPAQSPQV